MDLTGKKSCFAVYLFKKIKVIGGYITTYPGGIALHVKQNKAIVIPYANIGKEGKKFSIIQTFKLIGAQITTETGAEYLLPIACLQAVFRLYFFINGGKKERIENNIWLTDGDALRISFHIVLFFNLFILLCDFLQFIKEKINLLWKKKEKKSTI